MGRIPVCPQHKCHPNDCFEIHYPNSTRGEPIDYEALQQAILQDKIDRQNENIRREQEKMSRSVVDARAEFEERRRRGA